MGLFGAEVRGFGGAEELAAVWRETLLNIHTATYEAYGMTIVEAAVAEGEPVIKCLSLLNVLKDTHDRSCSYE
jgi:hypothetical protein